MRERHAVDRLHVADRALEKALADREPDAVVAHLENAFRRARRSAGSSGSLLKTRQTAPPGLAPSYSTQRTAWSGRTSISGGGEVRQRSITLPQRSAKRQPANTWLSGGTVPGIDARRRPRLLGVGQRLEQVDRVRMQRPREELLRVGHLDDLARVHQRDAMRHLRDDREIVRDEQHRHLLRRLQLRRAGRGSAPGSSRRARWSARRRSRCPDRRRARSRSSRAASARPTSGTGSRRRAARAPECPRASASRSPSRARASPAQRRVPLDHLGDLAADGHHRIEARRRLLEDDADPASADVAHPRLGQLDDVGAVDVDAARR